MQEILESSILVSRCPRQISLDPVYQYIAKSSENQNTFQLGQLIAGILMFLFVQSDKSAHFMKLFMRSIQLTTHTPLLKVLLQGNLIHFMNTQRPMLQFDPTGATIKWDQYFSMDQDA